MKEVKKRDFPKNRKEKAERAGHINGADDSYFVSPHHATRAEATKCLQVFCNICKTKALLTVLQ